MHYPIKLPVSDRNKNETSSGALKSRIKSGIFPVSHAAVVSVVTQYSSPQRRGGGGEEHCVTTLEMAAR